MKAIIVGGGIAGPATALALDAVGIDSVVLESRPDSEGSGSWLTIAPNGLAALAELGALDAVLPAGVPSALTILTSGTGRELGRTRLGSPLADGTGATSFRRPDLARTLCALAIDRGIDIRFGARVASVDTGGTTAVVELENGRRETGDLVIGADGIGSVVRSAIDPRARPPRYVGLVNFGGITKGAGRTGDLEANAWTMTFGRHAFFGALPGRGGDVLWFVNVPRDPVSSRERSETSLDGWRSQLATLADADTGPMSALIRGGELDLAADNTHDLPVPARWSRGRLVIVGDAAHAPTPSSGQGAAMALEDAVALARRLRDHREVADALTGFEHARRARVRRIVRDGARSSSSKTPHGVGLVVRDRMLSLILKLAVTDRSQAWKFDHRETLAPAAQRSTA